MPDGTGFEGNRSQFTKEQCEDVGIIKLNIGLFIWRHINVNSVNL